VTLRRDMGRIGYNEAGDPDDELQHFTLCPACQQPIDMRDLAAVFHHRERGHEPLPAEDAERLLRISEHLREKLRTGDAAATLPPGERRGR